jgi:hypothetical protein
MFRHPWISRPSISGWRLLGPFQPGSGTANVATMNTRKWVTPASIAGTVKLVKARK